MFVGRSALFRLVKDVVQVRGDSRVPSDVERPVVLLTGSGGSGRSEVLKELRSRWSRQTPTTLVGSGSAGETSLRPVLVAIMDGLSDAVSGYDIDFRRVLLAFVAMREAVPDDIGPEEARVQIRTRMNQYRDRARLLDLVRDIVISAGGAIPVDASLQDMTKVAVEGIAQRVVDRVRGSRMLARFSWSDALEWYRDQDMGLGLNHPEQALVKLSRDAASTDAAVVRDIDGLLVGALLADLRESLKKVRNRPCNPLVLLDNADTGQARAFLDCLLQVRAIRDPGLADPLTVVGASTGSIAADLSGDQQPLWWPDGELDALGRGELARTPLWLLVRLGALDPDAVLRMVKAEEWPAGVSQSRVAEVAHRVTGGYPSLTRDLLDALGIALRERTRGTHPAETVDRIGALMSGRVEARFLDMLATGLDHIDVDEDLRQCLAVAAAARNHEEAQIVLGKFDLPLGQTLTMAASLWSGSDTRGHPALSPAVRDLGLRLLARQTTGPVTWSAVFQCLLDESVEDDPEHPGSWLHHKLALGEVGEVAERLVVKLATSPDGDWLTLLDEVTATPALSPDPPKPSAPGGDPKKGTVIQLVTTLQQLNDPRSTDRGRRRGLHLLAENDLRAIAGSSVTLLLRARHYARLAEGLARREDGDA